MSISPLFLYETIETEMQKVQLCHQTLFHTCKLGLDMRPHICKFQKAQIRTHEQEYNIETPHFQSISQSFHDLRFSGHSHHLRRFGNKTS